MHLAGEADAGDVVTGELRARESFFDGDAGGAPPVFGILFGPADLRRGEGRVFFGGGRENAALFVDDEGARAARAYVNA